ncbi:tetratricopeptide repeat protein [Alkalitalea saponilacus]|uniref:histidine kinase n=1 Tax=Alkalitalea saponilacus TaxID=889453 RepID=A0A1T5AT77_9BACT|nr:tetratricopeptide repeat protein [Alkalitalea saponilacus]ASB48602.1 hypothetical protein CDL62_05330 [Alkalitalea saponilacus]SKB38208.1 Signal transduction histidine kinase [Alkalitalea saponilacus]
MKVLFFFSTFLLIGFSSCHQPTKENSTDNEKDAYLNIVDSLINIDPSEALRRINHFLTEYPQNEDELFIKAILIKGEILSLRGANDSALIHFNIAQKKSLDLDNAELYLRSKLALGKILYSRGEYNSALEIFTTVQQLSSDQNLMYKNTRATYYIGKYYHTTGNFNRAMDFYIKALQQTDKDKASPLITYLKLSIGKCFLNNGDTNTSLYYYQEAYKNAITTGNLIAISHALNHLGSINNILGQHELSLHYHYLALELRETLALPSEKAISYNNLGRTWLKSGNIDSAVIYFEKSLKSSLAAEYKKGTVKALTNLARTGHQNKTEMYQNALSMAESSNYNAGIANARLNMGLLYFENGDFNKAIESLYISLDKAKKSKLSETIPHIHKGLYKCYLKINDLQKAMSHLEEYSRLKERWLLEKNQQQLAEMFILFEADKMEQNNQILKADNQLKEMSIKRKKMLIGFIIGALILFILLSLLIYWRFYNNRQAHRKQMELNHQLEIANREKDKLMSIISHELRNPLYWFQNLTKSLSIKHRVLPPETTEKSLLALDESASQTFHLMDNLLFWSRSRLNRITPKNDLTNIHLLINQNTRIFSSILEQKGIMLVNNIPNDLAIKTDPNLIGCVFRNLVSNSIKFTPSNGQIIIDVIKNSENIVFSVTDNGKGIEPAIREKLFKQNKEISTLGIMNEHGSGLGLKLCFEFIEMCGGGMFLDSEHQNGTKICFSLPVPIAEAFQTVQKPETFSANTLRHKVSEFNPITMD